MRAASATLAPEASYSALSALPDAQHHDFAAVQTDTRLYSATVLLLKRISILTHPRLQGQRCRTRSRGVILLRQRCTKHRHDTIAHEAAHRATLSFDRLAHLLHRAVQPIVRIFCIKRFGERG